MPCGEIEGLRTGPEYLALARMRGVWESLQQDVNQRNTHRRSHDL